LFLIVYVDDFKMSGLAEHMAQGWSLIREGIKIDDPTPMEHFLGCTHKEGLARAADGSLVRTMEYDMQHFFES
jgi:hypothetical protein